MYDPLMTLPAVRVVITGASSGLGLALASAYAAKYQARLTLGLVGRNSAALQDLQAVLASRYGSHAVVYAADVRDALAMQHLAQDFSTTHGAPHVLIANAGVSRGTLTEYEEDIPAFRAVFETNVMGLLHTFQPFIAAMKQASTQGQPAQLVGIASVAGIRGLPGSSAYSASKAAAITYLESLRVEMQSSGIKVITVAPGYIRTPMTDINTYPMPFLMDADVFAHHALRVIAGGRRFSVIPWQMGIVARVMRLIPPFVWDALMKKAPHKARL